MISWQERRNYNHLMSFKSNYKKVIDQISGIFLPVINCLTAAGIIKSVVMLLASGGILSEDSGIYQIFYAVSDGFFYFLPFFLAYTASRQWKTDRFISMLIPAAMLYPTLTELLEGGASLTLFGFPVSNTVYHSSVIPVLLAVGLLYFVEKPCDKFIPEAIRGIFKPIICMIIVLPVTFLVFGRVGSWIGDGLTWVFFKLYDLSPIAAGAFMGFFIQPMVVVGGQWSIVPVCINSIATKGYDVILPLLASAVYGQAGACLALGIIYKDKEKKRVAFQGAFSSVIGVTEPALFGTTVGEMRGMIAACFAGSLGGALTGWAGTHCNAFAFPSLITSVAYVGPGFGWFLFSMPLGLVLGFIFTYIQKKWITK